MIVAADQAGDGRHELIGWTAVVEEPKHGIALRSDGISNRAAMVAGSEDQPTVWHQLWDATAKGTATRWSSHTPINSSTKARPNTQGQPPASRATASTAVAAM